ncbi:hypothetical protein [Saccharothrix stipae]
MQETHDVSESSPDQVEVGRWVNYHGSLDDHWGRYRVASVSNTVDGPRYALADERERIVLTRVSRTSITLVPDGPPHHVRNMHRRLAAVRQAAHALYGGALPEPLDNSIRNVPKVVAANRHAEAEHYLLSLEATVGCIDSEEFQRRAQAVVVTVGDDSWSPERMTSAAATPEVAAGAG